MRVLLPDLPEFRALNDSGEVLGADLAFYRSGEVPAGDADGAVLWMVDGETRARLLRTPGLQWALTLTAGIDHVRAALPQGVALYNASRLHDRAVAVHVVAGMLAAERGLGAFRDAQRRGEWTSPPTPAASGLRTLDGLKVVIWGFGSIGRIARDLLTPFGAQVEGVRSGTSDAERTRLLAEADWVVLLLPSTPQTRGLVNAEVLAGFKAGARLSNQGRGDLVVTADLIAALRSGHLGGAVLDVTDPEPLPAGHPLWEAPNLLVTPHVASTTTDLVARGTALTRDFLLDLAQGREPGGRVEEGRAY
ncbi:NAD(P)-dependent oxidoreductase [uncultured Deinococcus sp.]|uniref:NAD(P)-dependent oxidoreductase n=1 Tax=uncultured Deinococcus sp. TaxID=158789 RepID=UPI00258C16E8|nr:NAD(P)-dependent oxidoreductase [uncultured Deinococcus sp.]